MTWLQVVRDHLTSKALELMSCRATWSGVCGALTQQQGPARTLASLQFCASNRAKRWQHLL